MSSPVRGGESFSAEATIALVTLFTTLIIAFLGWIIKRRHNRIRCKTSSLTFVVWFVGLSDARQVCHYDHYELEAAPLHYFPSLSPQPSPAWSYRGGSVMCNYLLVPRKGRSCSCWSRL